jgi:hypothetical protein
MTAAARVKIKGGCDFLAFRAARAPRPRIARKPRDRRRSSFRLDPIEWFTRLCRRFSISAAVAPAVMGGPLTL